MSAKEDYNKAIALAKSGKHKEAIKLLEPHKSNPVVKDAYDKIRQQMKSSNSSNQNDLLTFGKFILVLVIGLVIGYAVGHTFGIRQAQAEEIRLINLVNYVCNVDGRLPRTDCRGFANLMVESHQYDTLNCIVDYTETVASARSTMDCLGSIID